MKALILAGGFAKRLWPLTLDKAKPLLPVAGKPVISHIVEKIPAGTRIIVSTNEAFAKDFFAWRESLPAGNISIFVEPVANEHTKKGALAAVGLAMRTFGMDEDWLVVGGDNFFTFSIVDFLAASQGSPMLAIHDIVDRALATKFGVVIVDGHHVKQFVEKPADPPSTLVGTGCYHFPVNVLSLVLEAADLMPDTLGGVFPYLLSKGIDVHAHVLPGYWNDVGSFAAYLDAHTQAGSDLEIPASLLDPALGNTFEGVNHIDSSCVIRHTRVRDSIVLPDCTVEDSQIDTCVLDRGARVVGEVRMQEIIRPS